MPTSARAAPLPTDGTAPALSRRDAERARLRDALASGLDRINFGCGDHPLPGWINIDGGDGEWYASPGIRSDVIALDIADALDALPDACAAAVYSEHLFEHFTLQEGHDILREWFRILKPGGIVRIVCPDLESESRLYLRQISPAPDTEIDAHRARWLDGRLPLQPGERVTRAMVLNCGMRLDGHKFIYDAETLGQSLRLAGFERIQRCQFGQSTHAALRGIDSHDGGQTGQSWVPAMALVVEAVRADGLPPAAAPAGRPRALGRAGVPSTALDRATAELAALRAQHADLGHARETLRHRLIDAIAERCAAAGYRRIALYGAGRHTVPIVRQPWAWRDIRVVAILDDSPSIPSLRGVPVVRPDLLREPIDAVVVSSDSYEQAIYDRALEVFGRRNIPILRIYGRAPEHEPAEASRVRLVEHWGLSDADARWLVDNRAERHDATLPMLPPQRTELHLRRYEFAVREGPAAQKRVLDAASGTGYGAALLMDHGAAAVVGVDVDPRAVDYAQRRFARSGITFRRASATATGLPDASIDLVTSFETIEHVDDPAAALDEFARVLTPGGALVLSTPNDWGLTDHHVHSLDRESLGRLLEPRFTDIRWFGQRADAAPIAAPPAAGIEPLTALSPKPETLIVMARRRD